MWDVTKRLLVLDIDETLVETREIPLPASAHREPDRFVAPWYVYDRPYAKEFLKAIANDPVWEFGIFTKSSHDYAERILEDLLPVEKKPLFVFGKSRLVVKHRHGIPVSLTVGFGLAERVTFKDLKKVKRHTGAPYTHMLVVDDQPKVWPRQYGNVIPIPEYKAIDEQIEQQSPALLRVYSFMKENEHNADLRAPEKRWLFESLR